MLKPYYLHVSVLKIVFKEVIRLSEVIRVEP